MSKNPTPTKAPASQGAPPDKLEIVIGDEKRVLFMSYGLLNELLTMVGSLENVALIGVNPELRNGFLISLLSGRNSEGKAAPINLHAVQISADTLHKVLEWGGLHVLDFFIRQIESVVSVHSPYEERLKKVPISKSSTTGSED